jgi:hypothetical protein
VALGVTSPLPVFPLVLRKRGLSVNLGACTLGVGTGVEGSGCLPFTGAKSMSSSCFEVFAGSKSEIFQRVKIVLMLNFYP